MLYLENYTLGKIKVGNNKLVADEILEFMGECNAPVIFGVTDLFINIWLLK